VRRSLAWCVYAKQPSRADGTVAPILPEPDVFRHPARSDRATLRFTIANDSATGVAPVVEPFVLVAGRCLRVLRTSTKLVVIVVTLLAFGCPIQAIVQAYGLDERTVASWRDRAGKPCQRVHHALIEQGQLYVVHVQADAHSGEGTRNDCVDGIGDDGFQPVVAGWGRQSNP